MLNHTYTSVKNANLVDCGKKQHIPSQPLPLIRDNYLGEYRTELDKKKVLANLGIATDLSLEWEYIKGDIGRSIALMLELDSRTKYVSELDGFLKSIIDGIKHLETFIGGEEEGEEEQNVRITDLESISKELTTKLDELKIYLEGTIEVDLNTLENNLNEISEKVANITDLILVSSKSGNALTLLTSDDVEEGITPGLYVPDLSSEVLTASENIEELQTNVLGILDTYVTKEELGGGDFDFVGLDDFDKFTKDTNDKLQTIETELDKTVKTGEDGHVDTLYVNKISKNNNDESIIISDSFKMESGIPLDVRFVVKSLEELHSLSPLVCYSGMGVIVSDLASLYILREPSDGIIDEEFIKDSKGINWKCPEDLVIEVLTQQEFDLKVESESINPNMFYYIHEEVVEEPRRELFDNDDDYTEALNKWLRVLQQKYMSAVWGLEIENLVASKASNTAIKSLESEIQRLTVLVNSLSGGSSDVNLNDLNKQVIDNSTQINLLIKEDGIINTIQNNITDINLTVVKDYVTKASITTEDPTVEYIFVKKSNFEQYKNDLSQNLSNEINTKKLTSDTVVVGENTISSLEESLLINNNEIALNKNVPIIEVVDQNTFDTIEKDSNVYYYIYNEEDRYITESEFNLYKLTQGTIINTISLDNTKNKTLIGDLLELKTDNLNSLVLAINELVSKIHDLTTELNAVKEQISKFEIN